MSRSTRSVFARALGDRNTDPRGRRWAYVAYDQLSPDIGLLAGQDPRTLGVVLLESPAKAARRPYHRQKLFAVLASGRQFALEQAARGVAVRHHVATGGYAAALRDLAGELGPLRAMEPAEREHRLDLAPAIDAGAVVLTPHDGFLTSRSDFLGSQRHGPPYRMDAFYRAVRARTGILMEPASPVRSSRSSPSAASKGKPIGGKLSFDSENRLPYRGTPPAPTPPRFAVDAVDAEVAELILRHFAAHPGTLDPAAMPTTAADAETWWRWARANALPHFGPFEDAMSSRSRRLFHSSVSVLVNLSRLSPLRLVTEVAEDASLPLATREGFVRQILGWREFLRHVHVETDGLRRIPSSGLGRNPATEVPVAAVPTDGGYRGWSETG